MAYVITPNNLGSTLESSSEPNKINVKTDNVTIIKNGDGSISAAGGNATPAAQIVSTLQFDAPSSILTVTRADNTQVQIDLSALAVDMNVESITDNGNGTYTFNVDAGGPAITLDLSAMLKSVTFQNTDTASELTGLGTAASPLAVNVIVSPTAGNQLEKRADGLYVTPVAEPLYEYGTSTLLGYIRAA